MNVAPECPVCDRLSTDNANDKRPGGSLHCRNGRCGWVIGACGATYTADGRHYGGESEGAS